MRAAVFICGIILPLLILIGLIPLSLALSWDERGFILSAGLPFLPERRKKSKPETAGKSSKTVPSLPILKILAKNGYTTLCYIAARLRVDVLKIHFTAAWPDPAATAAAYAAAGLAMDGLLQIGGDRIADPDLRAEADFEAEEPTLLFYIRLSMRVYRLLAAAVLFGFGFLRDYIRYKKGKET